MTTDPLGNDHPFGMTAQEASLARIAAVERARRAAADAAREHGPVAVPHAWRIPVGTWLAQTNEFIATRFIGLGRLQHAPSAFADALAARRSLVRSDTPGSGRVSIVRRAADHAYAMQVAAPGRVAVADLLQAVPAHGLGVAIATITSGAGRTHRTTYHLARAGAPDDAVRHRSVDDAVRAAQSQLGVGTVDRPVAVLRTATGIASVPLDLPTAPSAAASALVTVVDGTSSRISWRSTTHSLVAVVGLDGVVYPRQAAAP